MTKQVQRRRGTATQHTSFTGAEGELSVNTTNKSVHVHDNVTAGGFEAARADMDNVTSSSILTAAGITATTAELNYVDGVTSNIQTQLDGKAGTASPTFTGTLTTANLTATGTTTLAGASTSADITFGDNVKAIFGAGSDLQIYHDGNSYIKDLGAGNLSIMSDGGGILMEKTDGENIAFFDTVNSNVELFEGGIKRLETTSTGIDVTGTVTADGLTVDGLLEIDGSANGNVASIALTRTDASWSLDNETNFRIYGNTGDTTNPATKRMEIATNGDISFYEDTGTTPKMVWKSADERLGIGTSSPSAPLTVDTGAGTFEVKAKGSGSVTLASDASLTYFGSTHEFYNAAGTTTHAVIDSSGNLLVGTTDTTPFNNSAGTSADFGFVVNKGGGYTSLASYNTTPLYINRTSSDGDIVNFRKDGAPVGSIGTQNGSDFYIGSSPATIGLRFQTNEIVPVSAAGANKDAAIDVGKSNIRFKDLYLSGGVYLGDTGAANKLDDYEEGNHQTTITPSLSGSVSLPSSADNIAYTKVGRLVTVSGDIRTNGVSSPVGNSRISLPFAVADLLDLGERGGGVMAVWNGSSWTQQIYTFAASDSFFVVQIVPTATLEFRFSFSYFTS